MGIFNNQNQDHNVVELLRKDHETVKALFREFESVENQDEQQRIVQEALKELEAHTAAEEAVFYPAVRADAADAGDKLDESLEEHHVVKLLIAELRDMTAGDERYAAKFRVLAENVRHHLKEEESELFSRARTGDLDLMALGTELEQAKKSWHAASERRASGEPRTMESKSGSSIRDKARKGARARTSRERAGRKPARRTTGS